jgi:hypothetical protein
VCLLRGTDWIFNYNLGKSSSTGTLHEQAATEAVRSHVTAASKLHFKNYFSDNAQIRQLGQLYPIYDKYKMPRAQLAG